MAVLAAESFILNIAERSRHDRALGGKDYPVESSELDTLRRAELTFSGGGLESVALGP